MTACLADAVGGLIRLRKLDDLKKVVPDDFDWSQLLPHDGDQVLPLANAIWGITADKSPTVDSKIEMIRWMIEAGANPHQTQPASSGSLWKFIKTDNPEATKIEVPHAGRSAFSLTLAIIEEMRKGKGGADWSFTLAKLDQTATVLADCSSPKHTNLSVPQNLVDMWESVREMSSTHNVVFEAADGEVSAHDLILVAASPVLKAMLESAMKEGSSKRIPVKDSSSAGVRLFVDMLYTSSTRDEPGYQMVLVALDLSHRWQVHGLVSVLAAMLQKMITLDSFVAIAEAAVLKDLEPLQRACRSFGSRNAKVKAMLKKKGTLPDAVCKLLGQSETPTEEQGKQKRRRTFCAH